MSQDQKTLEYAVRKSKLRKSRMSRRAASFVMATLFLLIAFVDTTKVVGQAGGVRRYPTDEYYTSLKMLRDGKLPEAQHGMETALQKARHARDEIGMDAVPVMIRIGECLYSQGFHEEGLAQIDAALAVSKRSSPRFSTSNRLPSSTSTPHRSRSPSPRPSQ